jgi:hypothetical protein
MHAVRKTAAGGPAWVNIGVDPHFYFANAGAVIGGPGQPLTNWTYSAIYTQGDGSAHGANGEYFVIQDTEVPVGTELIVRDITLRSFAVSTTQNLLVRIRETDGTILGTAVMTPALAFTTFDSETITFDNPVHLFQGTPYLVTTEFAGPSVSGEHYLLQAAHTPAGAGAAGWGGTTNMYAIMSTDDWATWSAFAPDYDLMFSFTALVPEPGSTMALVGLAGVALVRRRARRV